MATDTYGASLDLRPPAPERSRPASVGLAHLGLRIRSRAV